MKQIIIASTSTVHGQKPLEYLLDTLERFYSEAETVLFIPFARPSGISHDDYTDKIREPFHKINKTIKGLHEYNNPKKAIAEAKGIYVGGGNTFVLVNQLYKHDLLLDLQQAVESGTPYLGTSAGSNICGLSMKTTNDMPIVYPPSFKTLSFVPFNINPHYLDPVPGSTHMGETRETRINEFHKFNTQPVVGLREGSWLEVKDNTITLKGTLNARIFEQGKVPYEIKTNSDLSSLN